MKNEHDYLQDLTEIRTMMEKSSKFISLSGWAGYMAGIYSLVAFVIVFNYFHIDLTIRGSVQLPLPAQVFVLCVAVILLILSVFTAIFLSRREAKKRTETIWSPASKHLIIHMAIPLISGGILSLILLWYDQLVLLPAITLIFYGLALFNAAFFTNREVRIFGISQIVLGLLAAFFQQYALLFWLAGFCFLHFIYGMSIQIIYKR